MIKRFVILALVILPFALAACSAAAPASPAPASVGTRVQVGNGSYTNVTPAQLGAMLDRKDFRLINVHIPYEGELAKTDAFIPYTDVDKEIGKYAKTKGDKIVLYCRSGRMSTIAAEALVKQGYTNIWQLEGGMVAWQTAGFSLIENK